jgi:hypothetical protein
MLKGVFNLSRRALEGFTNVSQARARFAILFWMPRALRSLVKVNGRFVSMELRSAESGASYT